jgi:hypothetical protein
MKYQRAAEFIRVPPDLTTASLYKYMVLRLLFPLHSWHCYVQTEINTLCARGIGGKRLFEGNGWDTHGIVSDFVMHCQGIERAYRSENGLSVGMMTSVYQKLLEKGCFLRKKQQIKLQQVQFRVCDAGGPPLFRDTAI